MKVHWTNTAEEHLDAIFDYIVQNSPEYAKRMVDRITRRSQQIAKYPLSGSSVPEYDFNQIREVIEAPTVLFITSNQTKLIFWQLSMAP